MATTKEYEGTFTYVDSSGNETKMYPNLKTDSTLSVSGKAADAKTTGDLISGLSTSVSNLANDVDAIKITLGDQVTFALDGTTLTITSK